jgi:hypothetical protein
VVVELLAKLGLKSPEMLYWEELIDKRVAQFRDSHKDS